MPCDNEAPSLNTIPQRITAPPVAADVVVIQDADLEYDPTDWPLLLQPVLAVAPPWSMGTALRQLPGPVRRCGIAGRNRVLPRAANHITGLRLTDVATC